VKEANTQSIPEYERGRLLNAVLGEILFTGQMTDPDGAKRRVPDSVAANEAQFLYDLVTQTGARATAETGFAFGVSSLAICQALADNEGGQHHAIDPNQLSGYNGMGLYNLERAGLLSFCQLHEGPSHLMLPRMLEAGIRLDFAFIDGWHTFDYTLLDFFYMDKMLNPDGVVAFHDVRLPSVVRVIDFVLTHRRYRIMPDLPYSRTRYKLRMFVTLAWTKRLRLMLTHLWMAKTNLLALQKMEEYEPRYSFYRPF